jgi:ketosteroid isomerase-like protein
MSEENVEIVRRGFEHLQRTGDFREEDAYAPGFVWDMSTFRGWPEKQSYQGLEGAREFMRDWLDAWEDWQLEVEALHDVGDKVVAIVRQRGRSKSTGLEVNMSFAQVFTLKNGLVTRMQMYAEPAEGLRAAGLSETAHP